MRRWLRAGIGSALGLLILSASVQADEEAVVKMIERLHGNYKRDKKAPGKPITAVTLSGPMRTTATDADIKLLKDLKILKILLLHATQVTDKGMKDLKEIKTLETLWLSDTQVGDAGLKELKELKNLKSLDLSGTKVTDVGLKELKECKNLRSLLLLKTKVTDAGVKELQAALPQLDAPTKPR